MSLSRVMPDRYPLTRDLQRYLDNEQRFGRVLDRGMIQPRLGLLHAWSADQLSIPELASLVLRRVPSYAWDPKDAAPWSEVAHGLARAVNAVLPPPSRPRWAD